MSPRKACLLISVILLGLAALPVLAKTAPAHKTEGAQKLLGTYGKWRGYSFDEKGQPVCYMAMSWTPPAGKKLKRGPARITITHRPGEGSKDVFSYTPGYNLKAESDVKAKIGTKTFDLFTTKDSAWARDTSIDRQMATAIRSNKNMILTGVPEQKKTMPVADTLDLTGAADAYRAISKACGLEVDEPASAKAKKPSGAIKPSKTKS